MSALEITRRYGKTLDREGMSPGDAPGWIQGIDNPYLHGIYAPIEHETRVSTLEVEGTLPADLRGSYVRNGPNNRFAPLHRHHWFDGDGMVHGIWFAGDGTARYANRWIETEGLALEARKGETIWPGVLGPFDFSLPLGPLKDTANTDLVTIGDRLFALWYESGQLYELDPATLATMGTARFDGLPRRISAHSKADPTTGDFIFFGYGDRPPYMRYGVVRPDGQVHRTDITLPGPRRPHDIGLTPNYSVLHDFPVFFDPEYFKKTGKRVPLFHPEVPTRYGIIPRFGTDADVKWFEFEPCYMLHVVNCWEEGDEVVMVGCRTDDPSLSPDRRDGRIAAMLSGLKLQANLYEWRMNMATGEGRERKLDDLNAEFPMINTAFTGKQNRYGWLQVIPHEIPATFDGLVRYDLKTGATARYDYGPGIYGSEAPFAARPGATEEDDGYMVTFVTDTADWSSACWVFDAAHIEDGPVAKVKIPHRIPAGFHATWMPAP